MSELTVKLGLIELIRRVVAEHCLSNSIGVAFSGGLDSTLLAKTCIDLGVEVTLLTIGFEDSPDITQARRVASRLKARHYVKYLNADRLEEDLVRVYSLIDSAEPLDLELGLTMYYACQACVEEDLRVLATAQGLDELFCGYEKFLEAYRGGVDRVDELIRVELSKALYHKRQHDKLAESLGVTKVDPFLSKEFIEFSLKIPVELKISGVNDKIRKRVLREVALEMGVPAEAALHPKKAIQYGSRLHRELLRKARKRFSREEARRAGYRGPLEAYLKSLLSS